MILQYKLFLFVGEKGHLVYSKILRGNPGVHTKYSAKDISSKHQTAFDSPTESQTSTQNLPYGIDELLKGDSDTLKLQADILDEVKNGQYRIDVAPSDLVDFGGQKSYDMTHQLFIQHGGSFVLLFDARFGLHENLQEYPQGDINAACKYNLS